MDPADLRVTVDGEAEATGPGVRCSVVSSTPAVPDALTGLYAAAAELRMERGGPQLPEGECLVTLRAAGWDGVSKSAHGAVTLLVPADDVQGGATLAPAVMLARVSRPLAGLSAECKRYAKKRLKLRSKCNALILKLGGAAAAAKCKDVDAEPAACDEGDHVEAALWLGHGGNDQQPFLPGGEAVDLETLGAQAKCQALLGKASFKFLTALAARVQSECVKPGDDSLDCRARQASAVRKKLEAIDDCTVDPAADGATGRVVPQAGGSCFACLQANGSELDAKCLKACFERELRDLADGLVGDVPVCGDGIPQNGEFCDDGNTEAGDGCSPVCGVEAM
jgi:cysteine-rich repeat protein